MLVFLMGDHGSGKDTVASLLVGDYGYKRISIGDIIRDFCYNAKYDVSIPKRTVEEAYLEVNLDGIGYIIDSLRLKDITVKGASDVNIAVPIKELVDRIGWEHAKRRFPQVRQLLVSTGNAIRSMVSDTYLVEKVLTGYDGYSDVVLSDVMYPAEVSYLLKNYRGCCVFIHGRDDWWVNAAINYVGYDYDELKRKEMSKINSAKEWLGNVWPNSLMFHVFNDIDTSEPYDNLKFQIDKILDVVSYYDITNYGRLT